jgi:peptidoglycan/LPS O-acetylase OafA/YrhL
MDPPHASTPRHLPGLDALRFLAAFAVIVAHIEQFKLVENIASFSDISLIARLGSEGVNFFFVLSGFLITYLLLHEQRTTGDIRIKRFYWKRVLRIWPLYFAVVAWSFFVLNWLVTYSDYNARLFADYGLLLLLFLVFLPNVALISHGPILGASQAWSIGVEEQFYLLWPVLLRVFRRGLPLAILAVAIGKPVLMECVSSVLTAPDVIAQLSAIGWYNFAYKAHQVFKSLSIEAMAWGALAAWMVTTRRTAMRGIFHPAAQWLSYVALSAWLWVPIPSLAENGLFIIPGSILYALVIVNVGCNPRTVIDFREPWMNALGKVSYGLYMLHPTAIVLVLAALRPSGLDGRSLTYNLIMYPAAIGLTLLLSYVSYQFLEMPYLRIKDGIGQASAAEPRLSINDRGIRPHARTNTRVA